MTARKAVYREENADKHGYARAPDYVEHSVHYADIEIPAVYRIKHVAVRVVKHGICNALDNFGVQMVVARLEQK